MCEEMCRRESEALLSQADNLVVDKKRSGRISAYPAEILFVAASMIDRLRWRRTDGFGGERLRGGDQHVRGQFGV